MTICLNMIVRDEAGIIADTLRNVAALVPLSRWVICDTGSQDGTKDQVLAVMEELGIPGEIYEAPWVDFAHNRNIALELCRGKGEFVLFFDADDQITGTPDFAPVLEGHSAADAWEFRMESESRQVHYQRKLLVRNDGRARWRGAVHEYVDTGAMRVAQLPGRYAVISGRRGARSRDPEKYRKDALLLERAFADPEAADLQPRHAYYCGNSWRDQGEPARALDWYERRTGLGGWVEEAYMAHIEAALILERQGETARAISHLLAGHDKVPDRAECLFHLARILRCQGQHRAALIFAREGIAIPKPVGNRLFVNDAVYDYGLAYELIFLTGRIGGNPALLPHYAQFHASAAPEELKRSVRLPGR